MAFATLEHFEARHGEVPDSDVVAELLEDASSLILDEAEGSDADWLDADLTATPPVGEVPRRIQAVCVAVAHRAYVNPSALSQKALGTSSFTYRGDEEDALYLTDRERRIVRRAASRGAQTSVTLVSPYSGDDEEVNDLPL